MGAQHAEMPMYMHPIELAQYLAAVAAASPKHMLEWGSGGSTFGLLRLFPSIERYVSIEHDRRWYERVKSLITDRRLELHHVPPAEEPPEIPKRASKRLRRRMVWEWFDRCENESALMADYVARPAELADSYDLVLIDGRARTHCLRAGYELLASGGVLVIHDAQRAEYRETIESLPNHLFLEPWVQGQLCMSHKP